MVESDIFAFLGVFGVQHVLSLHGQGGGRMVKDEVNNRIALFIINGNDDFGSPFFSVAVMQ